MRDPGEGIAAHGTIRTGVARSKIPPVFQPVVTTIRQLAAGWPGASIYLYGSVATGQARVASSDVDLLSIDLPNEVASVLGRELSARFADLCRGVEIGPAQRKDLLGDDDAPYGLRVFLRHYCVHIAGPDRHSSLPPYPADARAARGFNGDIANHLAGWRDELNRADPQMLGRRVGRKTLLAVAGLVSVSNGTWTTDRSSAVEMYAAHHPALAEDLQLLLAWATDEKTADQDAVRKMLAPDGTIEILVRDFATTIGLWSEQPAPLSA
ncbi:MAG: hypothetical protein R2722_06930 [Tessaracoccus sp.]